MLDMSYKLWKIPSEEGCTKAITMQKYELQNIRWQDIYHQD